MKLVYWIKFIDMKDRTQESAPNRHEFDNVEQMWESIRQYFIKYGLAIEWMIRE